MLITGDVVGASKPILVHDAGRTSRAGVSPCGRSPQLKMETIIEITAEKFEQEIRKLEQGQKDLEQGQKNLEQKLSDSHREFIIWVVGLFIGTGVLMTALGSLYINILLVN